MAGVVRKISIIAKEGLGFADIHVTHAYLQNVAFHVALCFSRNFMVN